MGKRQRSSRIRLVRRPPDRGPAPPRSRSNGQTRTQIADPLLRANEAERVRATIGQGSDSFGPHAQISTVGDLTFARAIEGRPAHVLGMDDTVAAETARTKGLTLTCCERLS